MLGAAYASRIKMQQALISAVIRGDNLASCEKIGLGNENDFEENRSFLKFSLARKYLVLETAFYIPLMAGV